jgi:hypothetical protein
MLNDWPDRSDKPHKPSPALQYLIGAAAILFMLAIVIVAISVFL